MPQAGSQTFAQVTAAVCGCVFFFIGLSCVVTIIMAMKQTVTEEGTCVVTEFSCEQVCLVKDFCDVSLKVTQANFTASDTGTETKGCSTGLTTSTRYPDEQRCGQAGKDKKNQTFTCTYFPQLASKKQWCQVGQDEESIRLINILGLLSSVAPLLCGMALCAWAANDFWRGRSAGQESEEEANKPFE
mmetsp:Transcript_16663/g.39096  ORF Transcript_16663/g.39096 Transcript_16663/m.39096 type:complete len:187 (-) Transcript_16663:61-621(-)